MSNIQIKQLYNNHRFSENVQEFLCLFLYLPFGILLFITRLLAALLVLILGYVLPNTEVFQHILFKLTCFVLGVSVNVKNPKQREDVEVYVSNCLSHFDHLAVHAATRAVMPGSKMPALLSKAFATHYFGPVTNFDAFRSNVLRLITSEKTPAYFRPEAKITNGRALLKFKTYPFTFSTKVQPLCIEITRPYLGISVCTLGSGYWDNVFYFMFSPFTVYSLEFLPVLEKKNVSDAEFADIVRQKISATLKVELSDYTNTDLLEWEKRFIASQNAGAQTRPAGTQVHPQIHHMAMQVKEVLPDVPYDVVYKDLQKTKNVDHTITNILEGHVRYTPESQRRQSNSSPSTSSTSSATSAPSSSAQASSSSCSGGLIAAASSFGKSAQERTQSFQERKQQLIESARKRYIEKHNLNFLAVNNS